MKKRYALWLILIFFGGILAPPVVSAQINDLVPYVSVKQEYSDNIHLSSVNAEEDFITSGSAGMAVSHRDQRLQAQLDGQMSRLVYQDNDHLDATNGQVRGTWNYRVTERAGAGLSASYLKDSRGDEYLDTTGVVLSGIQDRDLTEVSGSADYRFSELMAGELTVTYDTTRVDETFNEEEYATVEVDLALSRNMSRTFKHTTGLLNFSYLRYTSDQETITPDPLVTTAVFQQFDSDMFQMTTGFSRELTELTRVYLLAGVSYTDITEGQRIVRTGLLNSDTSLPDQSDDSLNGVLSAGVTYNGLYYNLNLKMSHDVRGGAGTNGTVERTSVNLGVKRKMSENFSLKLNVSGYLNRNERKTSSDLDQFTINIQPGVQYRITDTLNLSGIYRYTDVDERQSDGDRDRNLVYVVLNKEFDL